MANGAAMGSGNEWVLESEPTAMPQGLGAKGRSLSRAPVLQPVQREVRGVCCGLNLSLQNSCQNLVPNVEALGGDQVVRVEFL